MTTIAVNPSDTGSDTGVIHDAARRRNILIAMCVALMGVIASMSILNVAQQELAEDFGATAGTVLWILNAYTLALAALLLPIGAIGDRWGRKPVLVTGLLVFGAASVLCAVANGPAIMIVARAAAGVGAAMIMPVTLSVLTSSFPPEDRGQAIGIWAGVAGAGGIIGMFVAALMVDVATWRLAFVLPMLLVAAALYLTFRSVPNSREHTGHPFDVVGSILSAAAIGGVVLGIHEGPERGWGNPLTLAGLIIGSAALIGFVLWELSREEPLLDVRAFANRGLAAGATAILLLTAVMFGIFLVLFPFLQAILGWSALHAAVGLLPMVVVMMPTSASAPKLAKRIGTRSTMLAGLALAAAGLGLLAVMASVEGGYWSILPGLLVMGVGVGLSLTPSTEAITESLPADKQGVASALNDTTRELGGAVGVALLGSILASGYRGSLEDEAATLPGEVVHVAGEGIAQALGLAASPDSGLDASAAGRLVEAAKHAYVDGWIQSMWVGVAIVAVAFAFVVVRGPRRGHLDDVLDGPQALSSDEPDAVAVG